MYSFTATNAQVCNNVLESIDHLLRSPQSPSFCHAGKNVGCPGCAQLRQRLQACGGLCWLKYKNDSKLVKYSYRDQDPRPPKLVYTLYKASTDQICIPRAYDPTSPVLGHDLNSPWHKSPISWPFQWVSNKKNGWLHAADLWNLALLAVVQLWNTGCPRTNWHHRSAMQWSPREIAASTFLQINWKILWLVLCQT